MSNNTWRVIGKILKYTVYIFVFSVCALVIWRLCSSGDPKSMKTVTVTDSIYDAYKEDDALHIYKQNQNNITRAENNLGYFAVTQVAIIPEVNQIQIVFRYNNSTLRSIEKDLGLEKGTLLREDDLFDITLAVSTDKTPDRTDDNAYSAAEHPESVSEKRYFPTTAYTESDTKNVYNYRRYVFENVSVEELTLAVYVDIYYKGQSADGEKITPNYAEKPNGALCIYDYKSKNRTVKLSSRDIEALESYIKKNEG